MAITLALVGQFHNRLRYLMTAAGADTGVLTTTGAVTPDLRTDSLRGPIKNMSLQFLNGYGLFPLGALTQAQSRAIWMNDNTGANFGNTNVQRAQVAITKRTGPTALWTADANVDGGGNATITTSASAAGTAYLDVYVPGAVGA